MITYKVTNQAKFDKANVVDVDTDGMTHSNGVFRGHLSIEIEGRPIDETWYQGEHGANDYEDHYGFVLVSE